MKFLGHTQTGATEQIVAATFARGNYVASLDDVVQLPRHCLRSGTTDDFL